MVKGPSATNNKLSIIDLMSSRSMLIFLRVLDCKNRGSVFYVRRRFDLNWPGRFFLKDSDGTHFNQLKHREKRDNDLHPGLHLSKKRFKQGFPLGAQMIEQQGHLAAHGDLIKHHLMDYVFSQAIKNLFECR